jgi:hypothetical protein
MVVSPFIFRPMNYLFRVFVPLFAGFLIYFFGTNSKIIFLQSFSIEPLGYNLPKWIKFNLVDGLWMFSQLQLIFLFVKFNSNKSFILVCSLTLILSFSLEGFQYLGLITGTADILDCAFYFFAYLVSLALSKNSLNMTKKNETLSKRFIPEHLQNTLQQQPN